MAGSPCAKDWFFQLRIALCSSIPCYKGLSFLIFCYRRIKIKKKKLNDVLPLTETQLPVMRFHVFATGAMFSVAVNALVLEKASTAHHLERMTGRFPNLQQVTVYSEERCKGKAYTIKPDGKCTLLPEDLYVQ